MVVELEIVGGVAGLLVTALRLVPADSSPSLGLVSKDFFGVQLLIQVSNVVIIVLKVYNSFECFIIVRIRTKSLSNLLCHLFSPSLIAAQGLSLDSSHLVFPIVKYK